MRLRLESQRRIAGCIGVHRGHSRRWTIDRAGPGLRNRTGTGKRAGWNLDGCDTRCGLARSSHGWTAPFLRAGCSTPGRGKQWGAYQQYMLWSDAAGAIMAEIGVTRDADAVVVMVDAVDPNPARCSPMSWSNRPAAGAYMRILEGRPEQSNTTNGSQCGRPQCPGRRVSVTVDPGPGGPVGCRPDRGSRRRAARGQSLLFPDRSVTCAWILRVRDCARWTGWCQIRILHQQATILLTACCTVA